MKHVPVILSFLAFIIVLGIIYIVTTEVSELREEVRLLKDQVSALQGYVDVTDDKCDRIKAEVQDIVKPFTRIIPVRKGWWIGTREEENP